MELLLARHGNTFGPNDPVVWAGATNDLPLVEKGLEQAEKLASVLKGQGLKPAVYSGPLQRTFKYASIVSERLGLPKPKIDLRLHELDYGGWTGLTAEQTEAKFGTAAVEAWEERSEWPPKSQGGWKGSEAQTLDEIKTLVADLEKKHGPDALVLAVTSNGRLRYFLKLIEGEFERRVRDRSFKVKTGAVCKLRESDGKWSVAYWNVDPASTSAL
jgi:probable phosphoglycerate mutase